MLELRNPRIAIPVVLFAGILWSFGPLVVRYMDDPQLVPWQYIFGRGLTIFILLNLYLFFEEGKNFWHHRELIRYKYGKSKKLDESLDFIESKYKELHKLVEPLEKEIK